jgi:hypothetical protein
MPKLPLYSYKRACSQALGGKLYYDRPCEFICYASPCLLYGYKEPL